MQASMAATAGNPILSDEEYDDLKAQLRNKNSVVVQQVCIQPCKDRLLCWCQTLQAGLHQQFMALPVLPTQAVLGLASSPSHATSSKCSRLDFAYTGSPCLVSSPSHAANSNHGNLGAVNCVQ